MNRHFYASQQYPQLPMDGNARVAGGQGAAFDARNVLTFLLDNRRFIAVTALVVSTLVTVYALCAKPIYEASILIQVKDGSDTPSSIFGESFSKAFDLKTAASGEMEVLRSRAVATRAVEDARAYIVARPDYFPLFGAVIARFNDGLSNPGLFGFGGFAWGDERAEVSILDVPPELEGAEFKLLAEEGGTLQLLNDEQGIDIRGKVGDAIHSPAGSGEIVLRVERLHANPGTSFTVIRQPKLEAVERLQNSLKILEKGKQSGVIGVSLEGDDRERIRDLLQIVGREYIVQNEARKSEEAEKSLSFLGRQLPPLKQELELSEARYNAFRNKHGVVDLGEEARQSLQQSVAAQTKLFDLKQRREDLLVRFQEEHPSVTALNQQIGVVNTELDSLSARIRTLPGIEQEAVRLSRDVKVNTDLYTSLLSASQQLRLVSTSRAGTVRLLDPAALPLKPVKPWRALLIVLSVMMGLVLGMLGAMLRNAICRRVNYPHEIERRIGTPVSAIIPHFDNLRLPSVAEGIGAARHRQLALPHAKPPEKVVESLRRFRSSLQSLMAGKDNNIIIITGPTPGVGKSFVAANFAAVLAANDKRVILVDADLRTGHLYRHFGLERGIGLADLLSGAADFEQAIHKEVARRVDFLGAGIVGSEDPGELLSNAKCARTLQNLSARYDYVLIDTAPVLCVSDVLTIGPRAGATFCIVRGGVTTEDEIEETARQLHLAGIDLTGTILNDMKSGLSRYGYGARYVRYEYAG